MEVVVCYYQACLFCEYVDKKYGFQKILHMLKLYKEEKKDKDVFRIAFGKTAEELDKEFLDWLRKNIFAKMNVFPSIDLRKMEDLEDEIYENPTIKTYINLCLGYLQRGKFSDVENYGYKLLNKAPKNPLTYDLLGYTAYQQRSIEKAKRLLEKAVRLGSKNFYTHWMLGMIYLYKEKKMQKAILAFQQAKSSFPSYVKRNNPYLKLNQIYTALGKKKEAMKELEVYLKKQGEDFKMRIQAAKYYNLKNKAQQALQLLEEARDIYPLDPKLHIAIAQNYEKNEGLEKKFSFIQTNNIFASKIKKISIL